MAATVFHLRRWHRWQRASIATVARSRATRRGKGSEVAVTDDYSMTYVCVATSLERDLAELVAKAPHVGRLADSYLLRLLQYVARTSGVRGEIHLPPVMWGPTIFSRPWDPVSAPKGRQVLDALLAAGIVVTGPATLPDWLRKWDGSRDASGSGHGTSHGTGHVTGLDTGSTSSASASRTASPPPPLAGGESAPPPERNGHDPPPRDLRPRERERFGRVLDFVVQCGSLAERDQALELRRRFRDGSVPDDEIAQVLGGPFRWVTRERLKRHVDDAGGRSS